MSVRDGRDIKDGSIGSDQIDDGGVAPDDLAVADASGVAPLLVIRKAFTAGITGSADDVSIFSANAPFGFRIVDAWINVATTKSAATVTVRDATAGGGTALSDALSVASSGVVRNTSLTATQTVAKDGSLVLRRSDRACAGELFLLVAKN